MLPTGTLSTEVAELLCHVCYCQLSTNLKDFVGNLSPTLQVPIFKMPQTRITLTKIKPKNYKKAIINETNKLLLKESITL